MSLLNELRLNVTEIIGQGPIYPSNNYRNRPKNASEPAFFGRLRLRLSKRKGCRQLSYLISWPAGGGDYAPDSQALP